MAWHACIQLKNLVSAIVIKLFLALNAHPLLSGHQFHFPRQFSRKRSVLFPCFALHMHIGWDFPARCCACDKSPDVIAGNYHCAEVLWANCDAHMGYAFHFMEPVVHASSENTYSYCYPLVWATCLHFNCPRR